MKWADICWFEWCDELVIYGSRHELAREKKLICRIHGYEVFTDFPRQVKWECVNKIIFVCKLKMIIFNEYSVFNKVT